MPHVQSSMRKCGRRRKIADVNDEVRKFHLFYIIHLTDNNDLFSNQKSIFYDGNPAAVRQYSSVYSKSSGNVNCLQ